MFKGWRPICIPTCGNGKFLIHATAVLKSEGPLGSCADRHLQFDERLNQLIVVDHPVLSLKSRSSGDIGWWNDTFYGSAFGTVDPSLSQSDVMLAHLGTSDAPKFKVLAPEPPLFRPMNEGTYSDSARICVNERYVACNAGNDIYVCCFEDSDRRPTRNGRFFELGDLEVVP